MDEIKEEKQPEGTQEDEINLEDIATDVENIQVECKKLNCSPVLNVKKEYINYFVIYLNV